MTRSGFNLHTLLSSRTSNLFIYKNPLGINGKITSYAINCIFFLYPNIFNIFKNHSVEFYTLILETIRVKKNNVIF